MAQSEYAVCKCCHINGDLHMDARQIYRRFSTRWHARFGDMCTRFNSRLPPPLRCTAHFRSFLRSPSSILRFPWISRAQRCNASARGFANAFFIYAPTERAFALFARSFRIDRGWTAVLKVRRKIFFEKDIYFPRHIIIEIIKKYNRIIFKKDLIRIRGLNWKSYFLKRETIYKFWVKACRWSPCSQ